MTYSDKVKQSKNVLEAIKGLKDGESIQATYGKDTNRVYDIKAYKGYKDEISYSIWSSFSGMNIDKIGRTTMRGYTYDMMSQRTTYTFNLYDIKLK